ncbi:MAG TPA: prepilin peptidase [Hansschlegelia sp.]
MLETLVVVILPALVVVAAVSDLMTMTIPNRLVLALTIAFAAAAPAAGFGVEQVFWHLAAGGLVLAIGVLLFIPGWIGGGDAKLAAALALWLGTEPLLAWFALFALIGGALTLAIIYYRKAPLPLRFDRVGWAARLHDPRAGVPYGVALAAGTLLMWPDTNWFASLV